MSSLERHTDYGSTPLTEADLGSDPIAVFGDWLLAAEKAEVYEPNAMVVSTVEGERPSSRTVLLKGFGAKGFDFVTNYRSSKGRALLANPAVSLLFPWYSLRRQVIVSGDAHPVEPGESDAYFEARPRESKLASIASDQSEPIASRDLLEQRMRELLERYPEGSEIPRPEKWGAFRVMPRSIEFWQGRSARFHDRLRFTVASTGAADGWTLERLQP
ncbi:pyridoxamine 5'-phosphate oxidase [Lacisediminihabitans profunda]|uniref:Pyridoxine/pyridoxamine 5'-phosphate oxidase n=1 Tax=Lacisediminihabitans profunda TaxID=2594790 RepID=A0A5C8US67_9MICO|nr:pyridoxamine 5'-phosphate oxidase [Lacisediminihabitans profunda]TXN30345.1 pyridoxamine 5'-phosphate oxidase [Lacisediminihabitans profunda]